MNLSTRASLEQYVRDLLGSEKAGLWWTTPNPLLGGLSPDLIMLRGRSEAVYKFIAAAREANGDAQ